MNMSGMNMNMTGMNNNNNQAMAAMMQNQNFVNPLMQQPPQTQQQQQLQQNMTQRPGMLRAATIQQVNPVTGQTPMVKMGQFSPNGVVSGPNSAPIPGTANSSAGTSRGHTPQMTNQPQPSLQGQFAPQFSQQMPQGPKINGANMSNNVTPVVPQQTQQQQPTPQSQPRPGIPQQKQSIPMQGQIPLTSGQLQSPMQKQPIGNSPQFFRNQEQEQIQNDLNAKIFKRNLGNAGVVRVLNLIDQISNETYDNLSKLGFWQKLIQLYCMPTCTLRLTIPSASSKYNSTNKPNSQKFSLDPEQQQNTRQFELNTSTAPRFFLAQVLSGQVSKLSINLPGLKFQVMNNSSIFMISKFSMQYIYADGSVSNVTGSFKLLMNREFRIEWIDCQCSNIQSSISFDMLESQWANFSKTQSEMDKKEDGRSQQDFFNYLHQSSSAITSSNNCGLHDDAFRVLQIGDVMSNLKSLMGFATTNNVKSPIKALELFMTANNNQQTQTIPNQHKMNANDNVPNGTSPSDA